MSYAEMLLAIVPAAPPTRKNQRATSCPAPISAKVPYLVWSRLIATAFCCVSSRFDCIAAPLRFVRPDRWVVEDGACVVKVRSGSSRLMADGQPTEDREPILDGVLGSSSCHVPSVVRP